MSTAAAPQPSYRLIPSRFPPVGLFDTVATAADLFGVMELEGWTNDRLLLDRLRRLPEAQWVYGRPNASVIMASFLHVAPGGMRFNSADLGAWYAAAALQTAAAEVGHHLRREAAATTKSKLVRTYRTYTAAIGGHHLDLRGQAAAYPALFDSTSYVASQLFGERVPASADPGILYDSLRHAGGENIVVYRTGEIRDVVQSDHYEITVGVGTRRIDVLKLS